MQSNRIQLAIFDLDGVLTETSKYHFQAWQSIAKSLGIYLDPSFESQLKGISRVQSLETILKAYALEKKLSIAKKNQLLNKKNTYYLNLIKHMSPNDVFPGVHELLTLLKHLGVHIALGSASKNARTILNQLQLTHYFDYIVDPSLLASKPNPAIFLDAMYAYNLSPIECIGFEDAIAGITAIRLAGMKSIGIGSPTELTQADYCFTSIKEIPLSFIETLIKGDTS